MAYIKSPLDIPYFKDGWELDRHTVWPRGHIYDSIKKILSQSHLKFSFNSVFVHLFVFVVNE